MTPRPGRLFVEPQAPSSRLAIGDSPPPQGNDMADHGHADPMSLVSQLDARTEAVSAHCVHCSLAVGVSRRPAPATSRASPRSRGS